MSRTFTADELIANDSFVNYCFQNDAADVEQWQNYLLENPAELNVMNEARQFVLLMNRMLTDHAGEFTHFNVPVSNAIDTPADAHPEEQTGLTAAFPVSRPHFSNKYFYYAAAAVVLLAALFLLKPYSLRNQQSIAARRDNPLQKTYETSAAQKQTIWLPDSTRVVLNAKTILQIDEDFGSRVRMVHLTGEAFFDVTHNEQKPFIVETNSCKIRVLGTAFNVKAYPGDKTSETSLLRGSIELTLQNDNNRKFLLKPDEKAILFNTDTVAKDAGIKETQGKVEKIAIRDIAKNNGEEIITETAWTKNRLEFADEKFSALRPTLERWFDVNIHFNDEKIQEYQFTATFEDENIQQVLTALKLSYPFHYTIKGRDVYISK